MVYIIIVNWNGWRDTIECLDSIMRSSYKEFSIIIVDNGSQDRSVDHLREWAAQQPLFVCHYRDSEVEMIYNTSNFSKPFRDLHESQYCLIIIEASDNRGFGAGNNLGLKYALSQRDCDLVWLLNNDTIILHDTLSRMVETSQKCPGIIGSVICDYYNPAQIQAYGGGVFFPIIGYGRNVSYPIPMRLNFIHGASMMMDRSTASSIGFFDENIFMYFEEHEYCIRAAKMGIRMVVSNGIVLHKGGRSHSKTSVSSWRHAYRNKIYVMQKHYGYGPWVLFVSFSWIILMINPLVETNRRRAAAEALITLVRLVVRLR